MEPRAEEAAYQCIVLGESFYQNNVNYALDMSRTVGELSVKLYHDCNWVLEGLSQIMHGVRVIADADHV